jgi:hypothetical protein
MHIWKLLMQISFWSTYSLQTFLLSFFIIFNVGNRRFLLWHVVCGMEWASQDWEYRDCQFLPIPANQPAQNNLFRRSACAGWSESEFSTRGLSWNGEVWWATTWGTVFTKLYTIQARRCVEGGLGLLSVFGPIVAVVVLAAVLNFCLSVSLSLSLILSHSHTHALHDIIIIIIYDGCYCDSGGDSSRLAGGLCLTLISRIPANDCSKGSAVVSVAFNLFIPVEISLDLLPLAFSPKRSAKYTKFIS